MILFKLAWVSLLKEKGQLFTAAFGVAAAVGLLVWHCGLAETAVSQSEKAAIKATTNILEISNLNLFIPM